MYSPAAGGRGTRGASSGRRCLRETRRAREQLPRDALFNIEVLSSISDSTLNKTSTKCLNMLV